MRNPPRGHRAPDWKDLGAAEAPWFSPPAPESKRDAAPTIGAPATGTRLAPRARLHRPEPLRPPRCGRLERTDTLEASTTASTRYPASCTSSCEVPARQC